MPRVSCSFKKKRRAARRLENYASGGMGVMIDLTCAVESAICCRAVVLAGDAEMCTRLFVCRKSGRNWTDGFADQLTVTERAEVCLLVLGR